MVVVVTADSVLSPKEQLVLRLLLFQGPLNPYQVYKLSERKISYEGARGVLDRFASEQYRYANALPYQRSPNGGPPRRPYEGTKMGVFVYLCTMLENTDELIKLSDRYGWMFRCSLGKTRHFETGGVLGLAKSGWRQVDPWTHMPLTVGKVTINEPALNNPDITFHIEVRNGLQRTDLERWDRTLQKDPELEEFTRNINCVIRKAYDSAAPDLGLRVVNNEELAREGLAELFKNAKLKII